MTLSGNAAGGSIISGTNTLTVQSGLTSSINQLGFPATSLAVDINIPTVQTWSITSTSLPITGVISGAGGITKTGSGILTLGTGNTYSGGTIIDTGSVSVADDTSFGNLAGQLQLNGGAVNFDFINNAPATSFTRSILLGSSGGTIVVNRSVNLSSQITGNGPLTIIHNSQTVTPSLTLSGNSAFSGGLTLTNNESAVGTWFVTVAGTNQSLGNGPVTLSAGTDLSINSSSNIATGKTIQVVNQSALIVTSDSFNPSQVISSTSSQGNLELSGSTYNQALNMGALGDGTLLLGAASGQTVTYGASSLQPGSGNVYQLGGPGTLVISGHDNVLTGSASLTVLGLANLMNANNYTGGTLLSGGLNQPLGVGNDGALGSGLITFNGGGLTALNGSRTLSNSILMGGSLDSITGPFTFNGTVNLNGGTRDLFVYGSSPVTFSNVISNGILSLNSGTSILQASNTFTQLQLFDGGKASISSTSNLGTGSINFDGFFNKPTSSGTLETSSSLTLSNSIVFNRPSTNGYGTFQVDSGTILTLNQSISGGSIYKEGTGTLAFSNNSSLNGALGIYAGKVTSSGNTLKQSGVTVNTGGTFSGSGNLGSLALAGGTVAPGGGIGTIITTNVFSSASNLQFQFNLKGSPNYANLADSGNGLLSFANVTSGLGGSLSGNSVSIFLATSTLQNGDIFKGAFYVQSTSPISSNLLNGVVFTYYLESSTGTTTFNGQTFSLLDSTQYQINQSWVNESANFGGGALTSGQIDEFTIVAVPENQSLSMMGIGLLALFTFGYWRSNRFRITEPSGFLSRCLLASHFLVRSSCQNSKHPLPVPMSQASSRGISRKLSAISQRGEA